MSLLNGNGSHKLNSNLEEGYNRMLSTNLNTNQTFYLSKEAKSSEQAINYSKTAQSLFRYLAYRDIPHLIKKYVSGDNALDYGCGTGISTQFLLNQELNVTGVDVSDEMIAQARLNYPSIHFQLAKNESILVASEVYDLVFSSFVLFEFEKEENIIKYLAEAKRMMKPDGILIAITASQEMYSKDWLVMNTNFPSNKNLKSGHQAKAFLPEISMEFTDFFWTEADYHRFFEAAQLTLLESIHPLGKVDEPYLWKDEKTSSPFVIFVAKQRKN